MATPKRKTTKKPGPVKTTGQTQFSFLFGKVTFTTEPLWFRLTIIAFILAAAIYLGTILKSTAVPIFSPKKVPQKTGIIKTISKGRAP